MIKHDAGKEKTAYMPSAYLFLRCYNSQDDVVQREILMQVIEIGAFIRFSIANHSMTWALVRKTLDKIMSFYRVLDQHSQHVLGCPLDPLVKEKFMEGREKYGLWNFAKVDETETLHSNVERLMDAWQRHVIAFITLDRTKEGWQEQYRDHAAGMVTNLLMIVECMVLFMVMN